MMQCNHCVTAIRHGSRVGGYAATEIKRRQHRILVACELFKFYPYMISSPLRHSGQFINQAGYLCRTELGLPRGAFNLEEGYSRHFTSTVKMEETKNEKVLLVFDFDHTLIDNNCDTYIYKLAPDGKIPDSLKALHRKDGWTQYMAEVFKYLHENGTTKEAIFQCLSEIQLTNGMDKLLNSVPKGKSECIIISDANSVFIDHILSNFGLQHHFKEVFTNPAGFNEEGCLTIEMYHLQDWCTLSTKNLCKGHILANYIKSREKENVTFSSIAYVGDGTNDFCPSLRLQECDLVFPRRGYSLIKYIPKMETEQNLKIRADICPWEMGKDILDRILLCLDTLGSTQVPVPRLHSF